MFQQFIRSFIDPPARQAAAPQWAAEAEAITDELIFIAKNAEALPAELPNELGVFGRALAAAHAALPSVREIGDQQSSIMSSRSLIKGGLAEAVRDGSRELVYVWNMDVSVSPERIEAALPRRSPGERYSILPFGRAADDLRSPERCVSFAIEACAEKGIALDLREQELLGFDLHRFATYGTSLFRTGLESLKLAVEAPLITAAHTYPDWYHAGHTKRMLMNFGGAGTIGIPSAHLASRDPVKRDLEAFAPAAWEIEKSAVHEIVQGHAGAAREELIALLTATHDFLLSIRFPTNARAGADPLVAARPGSAIIFPANVSEERTFWHREPLDRTRPRLLAIFDYA